MPQREDLIKHLSDLAVLMQMAGENHFKIEAFKSAANKITDENILLDKKITGVGASISEVIMEFLETGTSKRMRSLEEAGFKRDAINFLEVRGIGPKNAFKFWDDGCRTIEDIYEGINSGKYGERFKGPVEAVLKGKGMHDRIPRVEMEKLIEPFLLKVEKDTIKFKVCGSIRRKKETVKDADIVVLLKEGIGIQDYIKWGELYIKGDVKLSFVIDNYNIDVWIAEPWYFGAMIQYATGSKEHNIYLRNIAIKKNLILNEKGIFNRLDEHNANTQLAGATEESIYKFLGLSFVSPEKREIT